MRIKDQAISVEVREQGDWVENIPEWPGLRLKTRGIGNKDWRVMRDKLVGEIPRHKRANGISPEESDRINATLLIETALIDWEGPEDDEGKALPYSKAQAAEYLNNPELEKFRDACMWAAAVVAERWRIDTEAAVKN